MSRFQGDLPARTFEFAKQIISLVEQLPDGTQGWELGRQLFRSGTSIGANVREADVALTNAEFAHRCSIARKEASETHYWLLLCRDTGLLNGSEIENAVTESDEIMRILSVIVKKTQQHMSRPKE